MKRKSFYEAFVSSQVPLLIIHYITKYVLIETLVISFILVVSYYWWSVCVMFDFLNGSATSQGNSKAAI